MNGHRQRWWGLLPLMLALTGCDTQHGQYRYAMSLLLTGDAATGARMLATLAKTGHAPAQLRLGILFQQGLGVPRGPRHAAHWFEQAAQQGEVGGQYLLAQAYQRGSGVPASPAKALEWFRRAAERGYAPAQYQVALAYAAGQGVELDEAQARDWFERAAQGGHHDAAKRLARAYREGELGLTKDLPRANAWEQMTQPPRF